MAWQRLGRADRLGSFLAASGILMAVLASQVRAHGEDKPGPHQGVIRMPGAFHTELVEEKGGFRVYLLDMNFKNPTVRKSSVGLTLKRGEGPDTQITCRPREDYFHCPVEAGRIGVKQVVIRASRDSAPGVPVTYDFPLRSAGG